MKNISKLSETPWEIARFLRNSDNLDFFSTQKIETCLGRDEPTGAKRKLATISTAHLGSPYCELAEKVPVGDTPACSTAEVSTSRCDAGHECRRAILNFAFCSSETQQCRTLARISGFRHSDGFCLISRKIVRSALVNHMWPCALDVCRIFA